jgi:hypothetical protein
MASPIYLLSMVNLEFNFDLCLLLLALLHLNWNPAWLGSGFFTGNGILMGQFFCWKFDTCFVLWVRLKKLFSEIGLKVIIDLLRDQSLGFD